MPQALKAIYHSGTFILQTAYDLPEGTEVELFVKSPQIIPPKITDIAARQNFLRLLVERMQQNPFHMPKIPDIFQGMEKFRYATTIDLNMGYYSIPLSEKAKNSA